MSRISPAFMLFAANNTGRGGGRGRGRGSSGGRGSGRGYCNEAVDYSNYLSAADRNYLSHMAAQQMYVSFDGSVHVFTILIQYFLLISLQRTHIQPG